MFSFNGSISILNRCKLQARALMRVDPPKKKTYLMIDRSAKATFEAIAKIAALVVSSFDIFSIEMSPSVLA